MKKRIRVRVFPSDILDAYRRDCRYCPFARAASRHFNAPAVVGAFDTVVERGEEASEHWLHSKSLMKQIHNYDTDEDFKPGVYVLTRAS